MKRILKLIIAVLVIIVIASASVIPYSAVTYYQYDGYKYTIAGNNKISLCGWDDRDSVLSVPDNIVNDFFVSIGDYAFQNNTVIQSVDLSQAKHLTTIGTGAFANCTALEKIDIPEWTTELSDYMFQDCTALKDVTINSPVTKINTQMFNRCSSLEYFEIPDTVTTIEKYAFGNCTSLGKVVIPKSVEYINPTAFKNDEQLIIYCNTDSYAQMYAQNSNIPYILLDGPKTGDANGDGNVDILDSTEIQKFAAEMIELTDEQFELADINDDGFVDVIDALLVQKYVVGKYDIPPIIYNS